MDVFLFYFQNYDYFESGCVRLIWPQEMRSEIQQLSVENHVAESQDLHSVQFIYIKCHITQIHDITCH